MDIKQRIKNTLINLNRLNETVSNLTDINVSKEELLEILKGYLEAALWTEEESLIEDYENQFDYSEDINLGTLGIDDLDDNSKIQAYMDIRDFISYAGDEAISEAIDDGGTFRLGMDIWLTRNGHGSGFFDHSYIFKKNLMDAAKKLKGVDLYLGDDLKLYFSNSN